MIKKEWFGKVPKWKMFFIRIFGKKISAGDWPIYTESYMFRGKLYLYETRDWSNVGFRFNGITFVRKDE